jgi:tight adherence protein B
MAKKQKEVYIPKTGIMGNASDYHVYKLSISEIATGYLIGLVVCAIAMQIMFAVLVASIILGCIAGCFSINLYRNYLIKRRRRDLLLQFRDFLESVTNSYAAGKNTPDAFSDALNDMRLQYGEQSYMANELEIITQGIHNNFTIEMMLDDFADRSTLDDIDSFVNTFSVCNRLGGNLKKVVSESREIINQKIEIEMEIQTMVTEKKNEINILAIMPFIVVAMMGTLGNENVVANSIANILVKIVAMGLFGVAYYMGRRITSIKV